jgi:hypothetical protein
VAGRLDAVDLDRGIVEEGMEQADGVRAAADAGDSESGRRPSGRQHLLAHFLADHRLEVAHHRG